MNDDYQCAKKFCAFAAPDITAPFAVLMRMVEADDDGDALFFSRDLEISGDAEAMVAASPSTVSIGG